MRKLAITAALAVTASLGSAAAARAANTYRVSLARVTPANAGTPSNPKPARIGFGYQVGTTDGTRPAVTTDYVIGFGAGIRATHKVRDARTGRRIWPRCPQRLANTNSCPANTKLGSGIVNNEFGAADKPAERVPCRLNLTVFIGDGRLFPPEQNDGRRVKADLWLGVEGTPPACPGSIDSSIPAQLARHRGGTAIAFHVAKVPFQEPIPGFENSVVGVTSSVFKSRSRVNTRVGRRIVRRTRGFFEAIGCTRRNHRAEVQFTSRTGQLSTAFANSRCQP